MATERLNVWLVGTTWWQGCGELLLHDNCFSKAMAVSQAFIFHFKCYSILHFAVCQFLCWAFLLKSDLETESGVVDCKRSLNTNIDNCTIRLQMLKCMSLIFSMKLNRPIRSQDGHFKCLTLKLCRRSLNGNIVISINRLRNCQMHADNFFSRI